MAFMNQEKKKELAPKIKEVCKKYGVKATLGVRHHSTLILNIKSSDIDFHLIEADCGYKQVNQYHIEYHYTGKAEKFLNEVIAAMMEGNHDRSDIMSDYHDVGWYIDINIGQWNKPYIQTKG